MSVCPYPEFYQDIDAAMEVDIFNSTERELVEAYALGVQAKALLDKQLNLIERQVFQMRKEAMLLESGV